MKNALILLLISTLLIGAPALPGKRTFTQSNGQHFNGELQGDEWLHWVKLPHDFIAVFNKESKNYEYAKVTDIKGKTPLQPSGILVNPALHENNPQELTKQVSPISIDTLRSLHQQRKAQLQPLVRKQPHDTRQKTPTKSKMWEEILKKKDEKPTPKDGED